MKFKLLATFLFISFFGFWISSCNNLESTIIDPTPTSEQDQAYPIVTNSEISSTKTQAYPISTGESEDNNGVSTIAAEAFQVPSPSPDTGVVYGTLFSKTMDLPQENAKIILANKVPLDPGPGYVMSFQEDSSPQTLTSVNGVFAISDIPPGEYVFVLNTPFNTYPILDLEENQIELNITGGNLYDLGQVFVYWP